MLNNGNGSLIFLIAIKSLGGSFGNDDYKKKMKSEGMPSLWVEFLYGIQPNIIFDKKNLVTRKQFNETYDICNKGTSPNHLKEGMGFQKEVVEKIFKLYHNRNGY